MKFKFCVPQTFELRMKSAKSSLERSMLSWMRLAIASMDARDLLRTLVSVYPHTDLERSLNSRYSTDGDRLDAVVHQAIFSTAMSVAWRDEPQRSLMFELAATLRPMVAAVAYMTSATVRDRYQLGDDTTGDFGDWAIMSAEMVDKLVRVDRVGLREQLAKNPFIDLKNEFLMCPAVLDCRSIERYSLERYTLLECNSSTDVKIKRSWAAEDDSKAVRQIEFSTLATAGFYYDGSPLWSLVPSEIVDGFLARASAMFHLHRIEAGLTGIVNAEVFELDFGSSDASMFVDNLGGVVVTSKVLELECQGAPELAQLVAEAVAPPVASEPPVPPVPAPVEQEDLSAPMELAQPPAQPPAAESASITPPTQEVEKPPQPAAPQPPAAAT